jgi:hypothetical protein
MHIYVDNCTLLGLCLGCAILVLCAAIYFIFEGIRQ